MALVLVGPLGVPGLAWSFTVAYFVAAVVALYVLSVKMRGVDARAIVASLGRIALAAIVTGEVAWLVSQAVGADSGAGAFVRVGGRRGRRRDHLHRAAGVPAGARGRRAAAARRLRATGPS